MFPRLRTIDRLVHRQCAYSFELYKVAPQLESLGVVCDAKSFDNCMSNLFGSESQPAIALRELRIHYIGVRKSNVTERHLSRLHKLVRQMPSLQVVHITVKFRFGSEDIDGTYTKPPVIDFGRCKSAMLSVIRRRWENGMRTDPIARLDSVVLELVFKFVGTNLLHYSVRGGSNDFLPAQELHQRYNAWS